MLKNKELTCGNTGAMKAPRKYTQKRINPGILVFLSVFLPPLPVHFPRERDWRCSPPPPPPPPPLGKPKKEEEKDISGQFSIYTKLLCTVFTCGEAVRS